MRNKYLFIALLIFSFNRISIAYQNTSDSLLSLLKITKPDSVKIGILNILSEETWQLGDYQKAKKYAQEAFDLCNKNLIIQNNNRRLYLKEKANACNNIAILYRFWGDYTEALKKHLVALKIREEIDDKKGMARSYLGIGSIYNFMGKNTEALDYKFKSEKMYEEILDSNGIAKACNHIAFIFYELGKYDSVTKYNNQALMIYLKSLNIRGMADVYDLFGLTYQKTKEYDNAIQNFNSCLQYRTILGSKNEIAESNIYLGLIYSEIKNYKKAYDYFNTALLLAKKVSSKENQKKAYEGLAKLDSTKGDYTSAFKNYKLFIAYRDSLVGQKTAETITQIEMQFENEKKEQIKALEEEQKEIKRKTEKRQQQLILYAVSGGLLLMIILAIVIYRSFKQKHKANKELLVKNKIIEKQKHIVEEKQKEIIDSINYAKRIQQSQMPTEKYISKSLKRLRKE